MDTYILAGPSPPAALLVRVQPFRTADWIGFTLIPRRVALLSPAGETYPLRFSLQIAAIATQILYDFALEVERTIWIEVTPPCDTLTGHTPPAYDRLHFIWNGIALTDPYRERLSATELCHVLGMLTPP